MTEEDFNRGVDILRKRGMLSYNPQLLLPKWVLKQNKMKTGDTVICINADALKYREKDNSTAPALKVGEPYKINQVILDSAGNPHIDVGLESKQTFIRSYETLEHLPDGDKIHWCHPSRFKMA